MPRTGGEDFADGTLVDELASGNDLWPVLGIFGEHEDLRRVARSRRQDALT